MSDNIKAFLVFLAAFVGVVVFGYFLMGCAAPMTQANYPSTSERYCERLDEQHRAWGALAKFSGVLASSGALVAIPTDDHKDVRWAAGLSAAALGAFAAASVFVAEDAAATWARECREAEHNAVTHFTADLQE